MVQPLKSFDGSVTWYNGGCLLCGRNYVTSDVSEHMGVDLETEVEFEGALALCIDCALQVGRAIGMISASASAHDIEVAETILAEARAVADAAAEDARSARLDRDSAQRVLKLAGLDQPEPVPA